jgi:hypothetical protein
VSTIDLHCAVVPPANKAALAEKLRLSIEALEQVLSGRAAFVRDQVGVTKLIAEPDFWEMYPDRSFGDFTCADGIASHAPDLVVRQLPLSPERARLLEPGPLELPIDEADATYLGIIMRAEYLERMIELGAPEILLRNARVILQHAFEEIVSLSEGKTRELWEPYADLMTGAPSSTVCAEPPDWFTSRESDPTIPLDCFALRNGFLVMFPLTSVVLGSKGEVRDVFPTKGLRPVGDSESAILFVGGGGPTSATGYFDPGPVVRDLTTKSWVVGQRPAGLPRYVAGAIGDVKWAIVADLERGMGYRISPNLPGDQCGGTTTSVDCVHAYDSGHFVLDAATGRIVLDVRHLFHEVRSFVRREDGAWRFLGFDLEDEDEDQDEPRQASPSLIVFDEHGALIREVPFPAAALARDGKTIVCVSPDELVVVDVDSGEQKRSIDLRPLRVHLAPSA